MEVVTAKRNEEKIMKHPPHWYFITETYCVLCGRSEVERERRYTPRPDDWFKRHEFIEYACESHFA